MDTYYPRLMKFHDVANISGICFKVYSIAVDGRENIVIGPVLKHASEFLAASAVPTMDHARLGYIVYHAGDGGNWLLIRTWLGGGIVAGLLGQIDGNRFDVVTEPLIECVWEEVPVHHERCAWVRHMMTDPPDPTGYLKDHLAEGYC